MATEIPQPNPFYVIRHPGGGREGIALEIEGDGHTRISLRDAEGIPAATIRLDADEARELAEVLLLELDETLRRTS